MRGVWTIYCRELAGLFFAPLAWVVLCLALFVNGFHFSVLYLTLTQGDVTESLLFSLGGGRMYWGFMIVLPPLLTMRMISEEARSGVLEFLLTSPVSDAAVIIGKLGAATTLMAVLWSSVFVYGGVVEMLGTVPAGGVDWGPVITGVFGSILVSALFCAIGLVASAGTGTPLLAAFVALVANIALMLVPFLGVATGLDPQHWLSQGLMRLDVLSRYQGSFLLGVVDSRGLVFFVAWLVYALGIIKPTQKLAFGVAAGLGGLALLYFFVFIVSLFDWGWLYSDSFRAIGLVVTVFAIVLAALSLTLDFGSIDAGVRAGAPKFMEWYSAYGLMVTLIWLYLLILRLLALLSRNR